MKTVDTNGGNTELPCLEGWRLILHIVFWEFARVSNGIKQPKRNWRLPVIRHYRPISWSRHSWPIWAMRSVLRWMLLSVFPTCWAIPVLSRKKRWHSLLLPLIRIAACCWHWSMIFSICRVLNPERWTSSFHGTVFLYCWRMYTTPNSWICLPVWSCCWIFQKAVRNIWWRITCVCNRW